MGVMPISEGFPVVRSGIDGCLSMVAVFLCVVVRCLRLEHNALRIVCVFFF